MAPHPRSQSRSEPTTAVGVLALLLAVVRSAGAPTEAATDRDGFLSHKAETHAAGMGLAAGYSATTFGSARLLGVVYAAAVYGQSHEHHGQRRRVVADVIGEPHYALGAVVAGAVLGVVTRAGAAALGVDVPVLPVPA